MAPRPLALLLALLLSSCTSAPMRPRNDDPDRAAAYHAMKRAGSANVYDSYDRAREAMRRMPRYATNGDALLDRRITADAASPRPFGRWSFLGPGNIGGRTRALVIDPVDPRIMYAAGVSGGIWKTSMSGEHWEPIGDDLTNIAVNALAIDPADHNVVYAGTGEGFFREEQRGTALPLRGDGIFVTRDGGASWTQLASTANNEDFHWINDVVVSSHDSSRIYAATRTGVWRSTDSGATWQRVLVTATKGGCLDLGWRGDTAGDYLFASCGTFDQATVYRARSAEGDATWESVLSEPAMGRTTLAIAPSNPSIIYALAASNEPGDYYQGLLAVYRSDRDGDAGSWQAQVTNTSPDRLATLMLTNVYAATTRECRGSGGVDTYVTMGWYCNTIAVDPTDPERVWVGGVDLFRSDDGGRSWGMASYWWNELLTGPAHLHADQHSIVFHPHYDGESNRSAFFTNDGGVFRTDDARAETAAGPRAACEPGRSKMAFRSLNHNYGVTQFYHGAVFPDGNRFIGGTQDNGTIVGSIEQGPNAWKRVVGGDGTYVAIDPNDPVYVYAGWQFGNIVRSNDGGESFGTARNGLVDEFLFIAPLALDANHPVRLWTGGRRMWRTDDRALWWKRASHTLPGHVSAIAVAPGMSDRVLAGTNEGSIVRTDRGTTATGETEWSVTRPREGFVSSLTFDPIDPNVVFATYAGFGGTHLWKSMDGGTSWSPNDGIGDGALPDIPVHSIAIDPTRRERLYVGTDLGVFVSLDGGASWAVENTGFAAVVTETVVVARGERGPAVYAFTHGRGAWRAELIPPGPRRRGVRH